MNHTKMHVAKTGTKAGQWVYCDAETPQVCRNGGPHIENSNLKKFKRGQDGTLQLM